MKMEISKQLLVGLRVNIWGCPLKLQVPRPVFYPRARLVTRGSRGHSGIGKAHFSLLAGPFTGMELQVHVRKRTNLLMSQCVQERQGYRGSHQGSRGAVPGRRDISGTGHGRLSRQRAMSRDPGAWAFGGE